MGFWWARRSVLERFWWVETVSKGIKGFGTTDLGAEIWKKLGVKAVMLCIDA
jgi:hypothetical protein